MNLDNRNRPLRRHTMDVNKNPMAKEDDYKNSKRKFAHGYASKKLTAIGCYERHLAPRETQEMCEAETFIKSGGARSYDERAEGKMMNVIMIVTLHSVAI